MGVLGRIWLAELTAEGPKAVWLPLLKKELVEEEGGRGWSSMGIMRVAAVFPKRALTLREMSKFVSRTDSFLCD